MCSHRAADNRAPGSVKPAEGKFMYRTPRHLSILTHLELSDSNVKASTTSLRAMWGAVLVKSVFYLGTDSVWVFCGTQRRGNDSLTKGGTDALTHSFLL